MELFPPCNAWSRILGWLRRGGALQRKGCVCVETHQLLSLPLFDHRRFEQSFHFVWPFSYVLVFLTVFLTHTPFFASFSVFIFFSPERTLQLGKLRRTGQMAIDFRGSNRSRAAVSKDHPCRAVSHLTCPLVTFVFGILCLSIPSRSLSDPSTSFPFSFHPIVRVCLAVVGRMESKLKPAARKTDFQRVPCGKVFQPSPARRTLLGFAALLFVPIMDVLLNRTGKAHKTCSLCTAPCGKRTMNVPHIVSGFLCHFSPHPVMVTHTHALDGRKYIFHVALAFTKTSAAKPSPMKIMSR